MITPEPNLSPAPAGTPEPGRPRVGPVVIIAAVLAAVGALLCGAISFGLIMARFETVPLQVIFAAPVVFPYRIEPTGIGVTLIGLAVLVVVVGLVVWLGARSSRRFAAVFFSSWFATIAGGWLARLAAAPAYVGTLRFPAERVPEFILQQAGSGGGWGLYWGWLCGLITAAVFMIINRPARRNPAGPAQVTENAP